MRKLKQMVMAVPVYGWIAGVVYFVLECGFYRLGHVLSVALGMSERPIVPKIPMIDDHIPFFPVSILVYVFSYLFWLFGPVAVSLTGKKNFINYTIGLLTAYFIGFLFFVFMPTYMDREAEGLLAYSAKLGFFPWGYATIYQKDGAAAAFNLFPSYHCLISCYCYLGIRRRTEIPFWFRLYSLVMAVLICFSTVLTKQHYFADAAGGALIALVCYVVVRKVDPAGRLPGIVPDHLIPVGFCLTSAADTDIKK